MVWIEECKDGQLRGFAVNGLDELAHGSDRLETERAHDIDELDRAQTTLPSFVFGDEGLGLIETHSDISLGQAALFPKVTQQLAELNLVRRAQRVAHCRKPGSTLTASPLNPVFGLSHIGIFL